MVDCCIIILKMRRDNVEFYGIKKENDLELKNINHYNDYLFVKNKIEK